MKYRKFYLYIFLISLFLAGCMAGEIISPNYYILEYYPHSEKENLKQETPLNYSVLINDTRIPKTYNRRQIVIRHFGPKITYADYNLWGVSLTEIIPNLIYKRISAYGIFNQIQREFLSDHPDFEINTSINNIELYQSDFAYQARLNMDFYLVRSGQEVVLIRHNVNIEKTLAENSFETYVQRINEMILNETDNFIKKVLIYFDKGQIAVEYLHEIEERFDPNLTEILEEEIPSVGKGLLLLPALTRSDNEPYYMIVDKYGYEYSGKMGNPVPLLEGKYTIYYGSGNQDQMMSKKGIEIIPRYKRIIEPDWGCLMVDIIDEDRNFRKIRYEIFDSENGESFGSEFPAEEEVGEQQRVWVLKPGLYKVTIDNEPFNTYRNFTTVFVEEGKVQTLTIVITSEEDGTDLCVTGAGVLDESALDLSLKKLKFSSAIHGNVNISSSNEIDEDNPETNITLNTQLDNRLIYDSDPIHYTMKSLIELGTSKSSDTDFRVSADEFDLKNTLVYYFLKNVGFYLRADLNSHFFKEKFHSSKKFYYTKIDKDGSTIAEDEYDDEVIIKPVIMPLVLKEGIGFNYRILNLSRASLSFRAGFGLRQDFNSDVYGLSKLTIDENDIEHRTYTELESTNKTGTELSLIGSFLLPFGLTYTTNADVLYPFNKEDTTTLEWENAINLKLFRYISLDYKLKLMNKKPELGDEFLVMKHTLFLRITYILR